MSNRKRTNSRGRGRQRQISVRGVRRSTPDAHRLSRAVIELAQAQAEADAQAEQQRREREAPDAGS